MKLKELRIKNNLRQEDIAKIINKSTVAYGYYESGAREPDINTLKKLANYFNVSLDYLCDRQWQNNIGYIPEDKRELVQEVINAPEELTKQIKVFIKGYNSGKSEKQTINFYTPNEI